MVTQLCRSIPAKPPYRHHFAGQIIAEKGRVLFFRRHSHSDCENKKVAVTEKDKYEIVCYGEGLLLWLSKIVTAQESWLSVTTPRSSQQIATEKYYSLHFVDTMQRLGRRK